MQATKVSGLAPKWRATGDGDYVPEDVCVGFFVNVGGVVSFDSAGETIEAEVGSGALIPANVSRFNAANTSAVGIFALVT